MRGNVTILAMAAALAGCANGATYGSGPVDGPAGRVTFAQTVSGGAASYAVIACFWNGPAPAADGGTSCRGASVAGCCVGERDPGLDERACPQANIDVGPVQLLDDGAPLGTLAMDGGSYAFAGDGGPSWRPGDRLEIRAGGTNGFPSFDVNVAAAAPPVTALSAGSVPTIPRASGAGFSWSRGEAGACDDWISTTDPSTGSFASAECERPGDPGQIAFPPATLQRLPAGPGTLELSRVNRTVVLGIAAVSRGQTEVAIVAQ